MNLLRRSSLFGLKSLNGRYFSSSNKKIFFENLSLQRSLIRISGDEVHPFLQGLITNDINHIKSSSQNDAMFTMFLNKQGRVLYDAIIYKCKNDDKTLLIECDRLIDEQLKCHLQLFRVRKKLSIDIINDEYCVWASFVEVNDALKLNQMQQMKKENFLNVDEKIISCLDPRLKQLGMRFITSTDVQIKQFQNVNQQIDCTLSTDQYNYTEHRYALGISEGIVEIATGKCFPFEANCDYLHGISFHKGCYLGQEFTARTYHTGVIRKRIMPLIVSQNPTTTTIQYDSKIIDENNQTIGKLKGIRNKHAIAAIKVNEALKSKTNLKIHETLNATTYRPEWWPKQSS